jgi:tRNA G18 (ribose-2'-O)-methylase SpoU
VLRSEKRGLTDAWRREADARVGTPTPGRGRDSLNVAVAAGVLLVEAARRRLAARDNGADDNETGTPTVA